MSVPGDGEIQNIHTAQLATSISIPVVKQPNSAPSLVYSFQRSEYKAESIYRDGGITSLATDRDRDLGYGQYVFPILEEHEQQKGLDVFPDQQSQITPGRCVYRESPFVHRAGALHYYMFDSCDMKP